MKIQDLDISVKITKSSLTGLDRVVQLLSFKWHLDGKYVEIETICYAIKGEEIINTKEISPYNITLKADNDTKVNPNTGEIVDPSEDGSYPDGLIGQYDLMRYLASTPVILEEQCKNYILLGASRGRYDI